MSPFLKILFCGLLALFTATLPTNAYRDDLQKIVRRHKKPAGLKDILPLGKSYSGKGTNRTQRYRNEEI